MRIAMVLVVLGVVAFGLAFPTPEQRGQAVFMVMGIEALVVLAGMGDDLNAIASTYRKASVHIARTGQIVEDHDSGEDGN